MIIVRIMGGLGNQMYQYALYKKLQHIGKKVKVDLSIYEKNVKLDAIRTLELGVFENVEYERATDAEIRRTCKICKNIYIEDILRRLFGNRNNIYYEKENGYVDEGIYQLENRYLSGYWQNVAYFEDIADLLRKDFVFKKSGKEENGKIEQQILTSQSVSVHVRRGDFLSNPEIYGGICTEKYYEKAFRIMEQKYSNIKYFFFTDDIEYVKSKYQFDNMKIVDVNQKSEMHYDMYLMSLCKGNIIANSSYSWWAAFLNVNDNKTVIAPDKLVYDRRLTQQQRIENWIYLDAE